MPWYLNTLISGVIGFAIGYAIRSIQDRITKQYGDPFSIRVVRGVVIFIVVFIWAMSVTVAVIKGGEISIATSGIMLSIVGYLIKQGKDEKPNI